MKNYKTLYKALRMVALDVVEDPTDENLNELLYFIVSQDIIDERSQLVNSTEEIH